jgi:hypothetical protein
MDAPTNPQGGPDPSILVGKLPPNYAGSRRAPIQNVVENAPAQQPRESWVERAKKNPSLFGKPIKGPTTVLKRDGGHRVDMPDDAAKKSISDKLNAIPGLKGAMGKIQSVVDNAPRGKGMQTLMSQQWGGPMRQGPNW